MELVECNDIGNNDYQNGCGSENNWLSSITKLGDFSEDDYVITLQLIVYSWFFCFLIIISTATYKTKFSIYFINSILPA
jgi:hypothetical protein